MSQERIDSLNDISRQAAEKTLQQASVIRDKDGNLVSSSWGPVTATEHYVPASSQNIKNAEEAYRNAKKSSRDIPDRPYPPHLVNDFTGILTQQQIDALTVRCNEFANKTSNQVAIVIVPSLYGKTASDVAYKIGNKWGVGQKKFDNGVVLLVKPKECDGNGDAYIAVGTGLEPVLTDDALNIIFPVASGEVSTDEFAYGEDESPWAGLLGFLLFAILFLVISYALNKNDQNNNFGSGNRRKEDFTTGYILGNILSSLNQGGFGRSGGWGGGSSGGWGGGGFGGFGGGGFSGGGAGGSW